MARSARDIAGYRLVAGLGEGGMARVYLALSKKAAGFSKLVVLKVLRSSTSEDPELRRMFFDEARVAALLNHPNVVQTYEAGEDEGRLFLAMEYLEGKSLSALVAARPRINLPLDVHLRIISDMLEGLHYAHGIPDVDGTPLDIIHRDVSPQNVLVTFSGQSKVVDFGIAKIAGSPNTQSGIIKGKVGYMAPEQILNQDVDRRADVFSAGVMIWEAIALRRLARRGEPEATTIARRMSGDDPSIRTVAPAGTPEELMAICDKAMSHTQQKRYASALELHDELHRYLRKTGGADQKSVAESLEASFGEDRRQTRAFVEEQLRISDDSSPLIDIAKQRVVSLTQPVARADADESGPYARAQSSPAPIPPILPNIPASGPHLPADKRSSATSAPQMSNIVPPEPPRMSMSTSVLLVVFALAAVMGTIFIVASLARRSRTDSDATGALASAALSAPPATASAESASPTASTVRLVVRTDPESATLLVDDAPQTVPFQGKVTRGVSVHLTARAPGFLDYDRTVTVDEDTTLDIGLSHAAAGAASNKPDASSAESRGRKKRAIDDGDPYRR